MKHLIPFRPLFTLLIILIQYRGIHWRQTGALIPWIVKGILLEPLRLVEAFYVLIFASGEKTIAPVFILGYYRSGTTWLQQVMATDPDFKTPTIFKTILPELFCVFEPFLKPVASVVTKLLKSENAYHRLPFSWDFPGEEDVAINTLSYLCDFNRIFQYPSQGRKILQQHFKDPGSALVKNWKSAHLYYTSKLMLRNRGKRLLLKSPPNTGRIALLKKIYPDAKFVYIKRNPSECIVSNKRLWEINRPFSFEKYKEEEVEDLLIAMYKVFEENYEDQKKILDANDLVEINYSDFITAPEETIQRIYRQLNLNDSAEKKVARQKLIEERKTYSRLVHKESGRIAKKLLNDGLEV
jgi:omega-hydroxy-beta-dihydromenaquinone-9 sulfotransferase